MNKTQDQIVSFANLVFHPMVVPNTGCIAQGKLSSGYNITVTGGNTGQQADGVENFLVEVTDSSGRNAETPKVVTKRNMHRDEVSLLIEHHYKNRNRRRMYNHNRGQQSRTRSR
jgi:hypothetical protein